MHVVVQIVIQKYRDLTHVAEAGGISVLMAAKEHCPEDKQLQEWAEISLNCVHDVPHYHKCKKMSMTLRACSHCKLTTYCSNDCQRNHWQSGHKIECNAAVEKVAERARC